MINNGDGEKASASIERGSLGGSAINYPGNPRFRPRCVFKRAVISEEMNQRCRYLTKHAVVITDE
jgi:hypothetical protein